MITKPTVVEGKRIGLRLVVSGVGGGQTISAANDRKARRITEKPSSALNWQPAWAAGFVSTHQQSFPTHRYSLCVCYDMALIRVAFAYAHQSSASN